MSHYGYVQKLGHSEGIDAETQRQKFRDAVIERHFVVTSIMNQISSIPYVSDEPARSTGDDASDFVLLITEIMQVYQAQGSDKHRAICLCRVLLRRPGRQPEQAADGKLRDLRDQVRALLITAAWRRPTYPSRWPPERTDPTMWPQYPSVGELRLLYARIAEHEANFRDDVSYGVLFEHAADLMECADGT